MQGAWLAVIYVERGNEDDSFLLIEPILAAIFYFFIGLSTLGAIYCDWWKAVAYYDAEEIELYAIYVEEQAQIAAEQEAALAQESAALLLLVDI